MQSLPDINLRAEAMWQIIRQVDFRNKNIIDLGCGHGDILRKIRPYYNEKDNRGMGLWGVDIKYPKNWHNGYSTFVPLDINEWVRNDQSFPDGDYWKRFDIAFCFSVLPYLDDVPATLKWMSKNFPLCLIECQYNGDGPGLSNIGADKGMMQLLLNSGFHSAKSLGRTYVEDRKFSDGQDVYRTIWLCETKKNE